MSSIGADSEVLAQLFLDGNPRIPDLDRAVSKRDFL